MSGYAVKGLKIFWGKVLPFSCSVRGITGVSLAVCATWFGHVIPLSNTEIVWRGRQVLDLLSYW